MVPGCSEKAPTFFSKFETEKSMFWTDPALRLRFWAAAAAAPFDPQLLILESRILLLMSANLSRGRRASLAALAGSEVLKPKCFCQMHSLNLSKLFQLSTTQVRNLLHSWAHFCIIFFLRLFSTFYAFVLQVYFRESHNVPVFSWRRVFTLYFHINSSELMSPIIFFNTLS